MMELFWIRFVKIYNYKFSLCALNNSQISLASHHKTESQSLFNLFSSFFPQFWPFPPFYWGSSRNVWRRNSRAGRWTASGGTPWSLSTWRWTWSRPVTRATPSPKPCTHECLTSWWRYERAFHSLLFQSGVHRPGISYNNSCNRLISVHQQSHGERSPGV